MPDNSKLQHEIEAQLSAAKEATLVAITQSGANLREQNRFARLLIAINRAAEQNWGVIRTIG